MIIKIIFFYYVCINLLTFIIYGVDKLKAVKHKWRIPESSLIGVSFLGGGMGALLGMEVFRHKTKHLKFQMLIPIALMLHVIVLLCLLKILS